MNRDFLGIGGQTAAIIGAPATGFGAGLTVFRFVLTTLGGTGIAYIGAQNHKLHHVTGIAGRQAGAHLTEIGAIAAEPNAVAHHGDVFFA